MSEIDLFMTRCTALAQPLSVLHLSLLPQCLAQCPHLVTRRAKLRAQLFKPGKHGCNHGVRRPRLPKRSNGSIQTLGLRKLLLGNCACLPQAEEPHLLCRGFVELLEASCLSGRAHHSS